MIKCSILATRYGINLLRGIEKLGGLKSYQEWLSKPQQPLPQAVARVANPGTQTDFPNMIAVTGSFYAAFVYMGVSIIAADGHKGDGNAWGAGLGYMEGAGVLTYSDWNTLLSKQNDFYIVTTDEPVSDITIFFSVDSVLQANATLVGEGIAAAVGINGSFNWSS